MAASNMDGPRSWKFTASGVTIELASTDFWVDPQREIAPNGTDLIRRVVLNEVWEHADMGVSVGHSRRKYVEDRIEAIRDFMGRSGTLVIDEGTDLEETYTGITLLSVTPDQRCNDLIEYTLEFGYPLSSAGGGSGIQIATRLEFGAEDDADLLIIDSKDMVVEFGDDGDKTAFKEIFRAAPIRVPGSLPLQLITVSGIIDQNLPSFWAVTSDTDAGAGYRPNSLLDPCGSSFWKSGSGALPHWIKFYRGTFPLFKPYTIGITPKTATRAPRDFVIAGSDDDSAWTTILTVTDQAGWVEGEEKLFAVTMANWKYVRITASELDGGGTQMELDNVRFYGSDSNVVSRFHVADRIRMLNWYQKGRARQLRLNNDVLLGASAITAHLREVQLSDISGLSSASFALVFAYGYGG